MAIRKGPFLQKLRKDSIEIRWEVDGAGETYTLEYNKTSEAPGPLATITPETFTNTNSIPNSVYICKAELSGLSPDTNYEYRINPGAADESAGTFTTAVADPSQHFRFVLYGDSRDNDDNPATPNPQTDIISQISAQNSVQKIDFLINSGDIVNTGTVYGQYQNHFFDVVQPVLKDIPLVSVFGNHERGPNYSDIGNIWFDSFFTWPGKPSLPSAVSHRSYAFTYGCARFIVLDSDINAAAAELSFDYFNNGITNWSDVFPFLNTEFSNEEFRKATWKIAVYHHPPFSSSNHYNGAGSPGVNDFFIAQLLPLLSANGIHMVLNAHAHLYERYSYTDGISYITSGGGGATLTDPVNNLTNREVFAKKYHFCLFDVSPGKISVRVIDKDGNETIEPTPLKITRTPLSTVLVMDRSGSMSEPSGIPGQKKVDAAIDAADLYISLLEDADEIGMVRYNHLSEGSDVIFDLRSAGGTGKVDAHNFLSGAASDSAKLLPSGATSIGAGIIRGSTVLESSAGVLNRAMVVLTDGRQNTAPDIAAAYLAMESSEPKSIYAVGYGLNQMEGSLVQITNVTGGYASITEELSGINEFLLQKLYVQILADASDEVIVTDPYAVIKPGERQSTEINIGETEMGADFILLFRKYAAFPRSLQFWLEAPNETMIEPGNISTLPNVAFTQRGGHMFFRCHFPVFSDNPMAHFGKWKVWVKNVSKEHLLYCSVICKARSALHLDMNVGQKEFHPGSPIEIVLKSDLYGKHVKFTSPPKIDVVRPDGEKLRLESGPDEMGIYSTTIRDTKQTGRYLVACDVEMETPKGFKVNRYKILCGIIYEPKCDCCEKIKEFFRCFIKFFTHCLWKGKLFSCNKK